MAERCAQHLLLQQSLGHGNHDPSLSPCRIGCEEMLSAENGPGETPENGAGSLQIAAPQRITAMPPTALIHTHSDS